MGWSSGETMQHWQIGNIDVSPQNASTAKNLLLYLAGPAALTGFREHGWHPLEGWRFPVILGICFGHAVTGLFWVCCRLDPDSFASLRWTVTVAIPAALGFEIQEQQPVQNRTQPTGCETASRKLTQTPQMNSWPKGIYSSNKVNSPQKKSTLWN